MTLILVGLLIITAIVWVAWPRCAASAGPVGARGWARLRAALSQVGGGAGRLRLPLRRRRAAATHLHEWLDTAALPRRLALYKRLPEDAADLGDWLATLSPDGLDRVGRALEDQCRALGLEPAWLTDERIPREWRRSLEDTVALCALAAWNAHRAQPLAAYIAWQQAPDHPRHRAFADRLYRRLVEMELITPPPTMLLISGKERRRLIAQAIRDATAEYPAAFATALQSAVDRPATGDVDPSNVSATET